MSPGSSDRPSSGQASSSGHPIPPSSISNTEQHRPTIPSGLRQTHMPPRSPELQRRSVTNVEGEQRVEEEGPGVQEDGIHPHTHHDAASVGSNDSRTGIQGVIEEPHPAPDARSRLLELGKNYQVPDCGDPNCRHGALSPKPKYQRNYGSFASPGFGGHSREGSIDSGPQYRGDFVDGALGEAVTDGLLGDRNNTSTTRWLADRHGIEGRRMMYEMNAPGRRTFTDLRQVPCLLLPIHKLDSPISLVVLAWRFYCSTHHGLVLHSYLTIICVEPWPYSPDQWTLFFRFQPTDLCFSRDLSTDGRWA